MKTCLQEDYYTKHVGFVIEGRRYKTRVEALTFCVRDLYMTRGEAASFLYRLQKAFNERTANYMKEEKRNG